MRQIRAHVLPQAGKALLFSKLVITKQYPLIAWYLELVLNFLHIPTQVLHSGLADQERAVVRAVVVRKFTTKRAAGDLNNITVLVLMYTINASVVGV
jgi:hypothetical protein